MVNVTNSLLISSGHNGILFGDNTLPAPKIGPNHDLVYVNNLRTKPITDKSVNNEGVETALDLLAGIQESMLKPRISVSPPMISPPMISPLMKTKNIINTRPVVSVTIVPFVPTPVDFSVLFTSAGQINEERMDSFIDAVIGSDIANNNSYIESEVGSSSESVAIHVRGKTYALTNHSIERVLKYEKTSDGSVDPRVQLVLDNYLSNDQNTRKLAYNAYYQIVKKKGTSINPMLTRIRANKRPLSE
jgi:hypothetical protein